jgi:hypothetical protein
VVERSPEKAGVGGSTPSRGTNLSTTQQSQQVEPWEKKEQFLAVPTN